jgi:ParB-like chromosome segregation protein Spo0J
MSELKIEYIPLSDIKPYEHNAKLHPDEQVEQIMQSIQIMGFDDPIAIWQNNEIIEGHGRYEAAKRLGMEKVPIIRLDNLTDEQRRAYALIHNKLTMNSGFDIETLNVELAEIQTIDMGTFDFEIEPIFDEGSLNELFMDAPEKETKPKMITCPHCGEKFEV